MASSEELSPSKVRKRLKLRRDKALVDTDTHDSSDQSTERNGRSTSHGLLGNGHSTSKKRKSRTTPRRGKDPRSGRKLAAGKDKRLPPVDIPHPDPPHTDSDCIMISDSEDDDNAASVRKPHVKLSIKQSPCSTSGDSWQVPSGSKSFAGYSDFGAYDDTVKREVVGTYATSRSVEQLRKARDDINMVLPDLTNDDRPNLPSASFESRKRHIAPEALDTESSPGEFVVVEQGAAAQWNASRKRYLKTRPPDTKSSSSKCVTTKRGKKATASSKGCILPPVSSKPSSSLVALNGSSNDISSSDETMAAGNDRIQCASHKPAPSTFELSSPDEFTTRMCGKKTTGSRKRHLKPGPSNVDSLSDEPVTSKSQHEDKDSLIKPVSSQSEARLHTSLTPKCGRTLKLSCRRHVKHTRSTLSPNVFVRAEGDHESEYVDPDGSTDSDEPLTDVVMRKMERMQMQEGVPQTSDDVSAHGDNDASHCLPAVKGDHTHTKTKETTLHDDSEQSDSVTSSSHPAALRPPSTDEYRPTSPTFVSKLSREMEDGDVICQRMIAISPPMDVDRSVDITPCDINSVCNEVGSRDDHNTDSRSPQVASPSERAVSHVLESRNKEPQPARSSVKQTVEVALKDIMVCKCAKCSSIRGRFLTQHKDFSATESHSAVKTAVQPHLFTQGGNVYDFVKRNSRNRNFFADFVENMNNVSACPVQSRGKDTTSHCQEGSANSALSTVEAGSIVRERRDILGDLMKMRQDSNNDI